MFWISRQACESGGAAGSGMGEDLDRRRLGRRELVETRAKGAADHQPVVALQHVELIDLAARPVGALAEAVDVLGHLSREGLREGVRVLKAVPDVGGLLVTAGQQRHYLGRVLRHGDVAAARRYDPHGGDDAGHRGLTDRSAEQRLGVVSGEQLAGQVLLLRRGIADRWRAGAGRCGASLPLTTLLLLRLLSATPGGCQQQGAKAGQDASSTHREQNSFQLFAGLAGTSARARSGNSSKSSPLPRWGRWRSWRTATMRAAGSTTRYWPRAPLASKPMGGPVATFGVGRLRAGTLSTHRLRALSWPKARSRVGNSSWRGISRPASGASAARNAGSAPPLRQVSSSG